MKLVLALLLSVQAFQTPRPRPAAQIQRRAILDDDDGSIGNGTPNFNTMRMRK